MKRIKLLVATFAVAILGAFALIPASSVGALDPLTAACDGSESKSVVCDDVNKSQDANDIIGNVVNILIYITGALAVIMIVVAGLFYVTSAGDSGKVARAKNTMMYAIIGLVVAFLAYA